MNLRSGREPDSDWTPAHKKIRASEEARIPDVLTGPVHPFGSLAALSVPPSERSRPNALRPCLAAGLPFRGRLLGGLHFNSAVTKTHCRHIYLERVRTRANRNRR